MLILLVSPNQERLNQLKDAIQPAGFRTISARGLDAAWTRTDFFDFGAVVIDHELKSDCAAEDFRRRFITLLLNEDTSPQSVVMDLMNLFNGASELVH